MGRSPCCDDQVLKKGPWTPEEDKKLVEYIRKHGLGGWGALPKNAGLNRCGKSCRLRWTNYLRPDIKRGKFSEEEERLIVHLHSILGNKWSAMAAHLPGRTDNEIKNYWNTHLKKKLLREGIDPVTHRPRADLALLANVIAAANVGNLGSSLWDGGALRMQAAGAAQLARFQLLQTVVRAIIANTPSSADLVRLGASASLRTAPSGDGLLQPGRQFQGLLDSTLDSLLQGVTSDTGGLPPSRMDTAISQDLDLIGQPRDSLGGGGLLSPADIPSSKVSSTVHNNCSTVDHQVSSSCNTMTAASTPSMAASASSEHVTMDQLQDMMNAGYVSDNSFTAAFEPWRDLSEPESASYWNDILDQTEPQSWPITS